MRKKERPQSVVTSSAITTVVLCAGIHGAVPSDESSAARCCPHPRRTAGRPSVACPQGTRSAGSRLETEAGCAAVACQLRTHTRAPRSWIGCWCLCVASSSCRRTNGTHPAKHCPLAAQSARQGTGRRGWSARWSWNTCLDRMEWAWSMTAGSTCLQGTCRPSARRRVNSSRRGNSDPVL